MEEIQAKQVIVMRTDLNMRKGKMIAQGGHGVLMPLLRMMRGGVDFEDYKPEIVDGKYRMVLEIDIGSPLDVWLRSGVFKKICCGVGSEAELLDIYENAKQAGLPAEIVCDSGLTEFHGAPTLTCVVIGPDEAGKIDKITGHLRLL